jgi:hypothetical protein
MAGADIPDGDCECEKYERNYRNKWGIFGVHGAAEHAYARIKGCEAEGNDPAQEKLHGSAVDGERVTSKCNYVPNGRVYADAIFKPKGNRAQQQKKRDVNNRSAKAEEEKHREFRRRPHQAQVPGSPPEAKNAGGDLLQGLDAKGLEEHLKKRRNRTQQDAIEFTLDDEIVAEVVEIHADDVEYAVRDQRKAVEKQDFFESPACQLRRLMEQNNDEPKRENCCRKTGSQTNEEITAIADAHLGVLGEVIEEKQSVALRGGNKAAEADFFFRRISDGQGTIHQPNPRES